MARCYQYNYSQGSIGMAVIYLIYAIIGFWTVILPLIFIPMAIKELLRS